MPEKEQKHFTYQEDEPEMIPLSEQEAFEHYVSEFGIKPDDTKDKVILDIGSGSNPSFVKYLLENNITNQAYALDHWEFLKELDWYSKEGHEKHPRKHLERSPVKSHYVKGKAEAPPFRQKTFDLITMRAATTLETDFVELFDKVPNLLKPGGKFLLYPVFREHGDEKKRIEDALLSLNTEDFDIAWTEREIYRAGNKEYHKDLLTIQRRALSSH